MIGFLVCAAMAAVNVAFFVSDTSFWWSAAGAVFCGFGGAACLAMWLKTPKGY